MVYMYNKGTNLNSPNDIRSTWVKFVSFVQINDANEC